MDSSRLDEIEVPKGVDVIAAFETKAIDALRADAQLMGKIRDSGAAWGSVKAFFLQHLPETLDDRSGAATVRGHGTTGWQPYTPFSSMYRSANQHLHYTANASWRSLRSAITRPGTNS